MNEEKAQVEEPEMDFNTVLDEYKKFVDGGKPDTVLMIVAKEGNILRVVNGQADTMVAIVKSVINSTPNMFGILKQALMEFQWDNDYEGGKQPAMPPETTAEVPTAPLKVVKDEEG